MTATRVSRARNEPRRPAVLAVVAVALVAGIVVSVVVSSPRPGVRAQSDALVGRGTQSSAFYCGGLEHVAGRVDGTVAIADLAATPRTVEVITTDAQEQVSVRQLSVAPGAVVHVAPGRLLTGTLEAVSVDASGGDVAVSEALRGENGVAVAPCLSQAAPSWWVTGGSTEPGESFVLSVLNPYASRAVVSVTLETPSGIVVPTAYGGLVLGPHQLDALFVHDVAPNEELITAHAVASDGDVVVYGVNRGTQHQTSISLLPAAPSASRVAVLPSSSSSSSFSTSLLFASTASSTVTATVAVLAPPGCTARCPAPFTVSVPPDQTTALTLSPSSRVPLDEQLATVITASAPGVVCTEEVSSIKAFGQSTPLYDPQFAGADQLVLVNPLATSFDDLGVVNPTGASVRVQLETVSASGPKVIGLSYELPAHSNLSLGAKALDGTDDGVLELVASGPIVASGQVHGATNGSATLVAVPG